MKQTTGYFTGDIHNLKTVLDQQHVHLLKMLTILKQEHQALQNSNLTQFEDIVQQTQTKDVTSIIERKIILSDIAKQSIKDNASESIRAIDLLNKMDGLYMEKNRSMNYKHEPTIINIISD